MLLYQRAVEGGQFLIVAAVPIHVSINLELMSSST